MSQWKPLPSSNLKAVRYFRTHGLLAVEFRPKGAQAAARLTGQVWIYAPVPWAVYMGLLNASSHGKYFNRYIRLSFQRLRVPYATALQVGLISGKESR